MVGEEYVEALNALVESPMIPLDGVEDEIMWAGLQHHELNFLELQVEVEEEEEEEEDEEADVILDLFGEFIDGPLEQDEICTICQYRIKDSKLISVKSPCGHLFHGKCIRKILISYGHRCPNFLNGWQVPEDEKAAANDNEE